MQFMQFIFLLYCNSTNKNGKKLYRGRFFGAGRTLDDSNCTRIEVCDAFTKYVYILNICVFAFRYIILNYCSLYAIWIRASSLWVRYSCCVIDFEKSYLFMIVYGSICPQQVCNLLCLYCNIIITRVFFSSLLYYTYNISPYVCFLMWLRRAITFLFIYYYFYFFKNFFQCIYLSFF